MGLLSSPTPSRSTGSARFKVRFEDSHGESFEFAYALDWAMNLDRLSVDTYGVHHRVKELKKLREQLGKRTPKS